MRSVLDSWSLSYIHTVLFLPDIFLAGNPPHLMRAHSVTYMPHRAQKIPHCSIPSRAIGNSKGLSKNPIHRPPMFQFLIYPARFSVLTRSFPQFILPSCGSIPWLWSFLLIPKYTWYPISLRDLA